MNGTWTGLLGELHRDETDIGLANLYITINRLGALDYSAPYSDDVRNVLILSHKIISKTNCLYLNMK